MADQEFVPVSMLNLEADTEELIGFNPEADANAMLPPVPAGEYPVIIRFASDDPDKRWATGVWGSDQQKVYYTSVLCTIYGGGDYDGRVVRHQASTYTMERSGTNSLQALLQGLGMQEQLKSARTRTALVLLLNDALAGDGAPATIETDWEATETLNEEERAAYKAKGKKPFRMQGMTRFEKIVGPDGKTVTGYQPVARHEGVDCRAYNIVRRFIVGAATGAAAQSAPQHTAPQPVQAPRAASAAPPPVPAAAHGAPQAARRSTGAAGGPPVPAGARR